MSVPRLFFRLVRLVRLVRPLRPLRPLLVLLVLLSPLLVPTPARAQQMSLSQLYVLSGPIRARDHSRDMNDWVFKPATAQAALEPLTWAWWPETPWGPEPGGAVPGKEDTGTEQPAGKGIPPLQLSLRPLVPGAATGFDVVLFIRRLSIFNRFHREMGLQRLLSVKVNCLGPDCQGERFTTGRATIIFYQGKAGDYPYIIVLHPLPKPNAPAPDETPAVLVPAKKAVKAAKVPAPAPTPAAAPTSTPGLPADSLRAQPGTSPGPEIK